MNATKFVVLLLIGALCANVGARQLEEVSKDTKLSISRPKTSTKGIGAELDVTSYVNGYDSSYGSSYAARGPTVASGYGNHYISTSGSVQATGPVTSGTTNTGVGSGATSGAATSGTRAAGYGTGTGGGSTTATGSSSSPNPSTST